MALVAALLLSMISCRTWIEYVHTAQNPADKLSRGGYDDPTVKKLLGTKEWIKHQPVVDWSSICDHDLAAPAALLRRWGVEPGSSSVGDTTRALQ